MVQFSPSPAGGTTFSSVILEKFQESKEQEGVGGGGEEEQEEERRKKWRRSFCWKSTPVLESDRTSCQTVT